MTEVHELQPAARAVERPRRLFAADATVHALRGARTAYDRVAGRRLAVWLYGKPPSELLVAGAWALVPAPGAPEVEIDSVKAAEEPSPHVVLTISGTPSTARYRLVVEPPEGVQFDPLRTWLPVQLRPECAAASRFDDGATQLGVAPPSPVHDYTARDWRSLRQALIEYLLQEDPAADLSPADPTITLLELFAHVGDLLHYRLDRVATEAYLETARLRTSVRRHARLMDYRLADGVAARAHVAVLVEPQDGSDAELDVLPGDVATDVSGSSLAFTLERAPGSAADDHEPLLRAWASRCEIAIYDWGEPSACLTEGATECVLVRPIPSRSPGGQWLGAGDLLAFELVEPVDPADHFAWAHGDANHPWPPHRAGAAYRSPLPGRPAQVVELVEAEPFEDPLAPGIALTRVRWRPEDALSTSYPVSIDDSEGVARVVVARANVLPAHHGRLVSGATALELRTSSEYSLIACGAPEALGRPGGPGLSLREDGYPHRLDVDVDLPSRMTVRVPVLDTLLDAQPGELAYVVDVEDTEPPLLRFVTGAVGTPPPLDSVVRVAYEVGGGDAGNVPAGALRLLERLGQDEHAGPSWLPVAAVHNPAPAFGGADPESLEVARRRAPVAAAAVPRRTVLAADVASAAAKSPGVRFAVASPTWTGSWPLTTARLDLTTPGDADAVAAAQRQLDAMRMLGTEVRAAEARVVGIVLGLRVLVVPGGDRTLVRQQVLGALRPGSDARPGVFHPSRLTFGSNVYVSAAVAAVEALPLVSAVEVLEARLLDEPAGTLHTVLEFLPNQVPALDDNPDQPDRGWLDVTIGGGA